MRLRCSQHVWLDIFHLKPLVPISMSNQKNFRSNQTEKKEEIAHHCPQAAVLTTVENNSAGDTFKLLFFHTSWKQWSNVVGSAKRPLSKLSLEKRNSKIGWVMAKLSNFKDTLSFSLKSQAEKIGCLWGSITLPFLVRFCCFFFPAKA